MKKQQGLGWHTAVFVTESFNFFETCSYQADRANEQLFLV